MNKLITLLIVVILTLSQTTMCDQQDEKNAAHFGMSYTISMLSYGFFEKVFRMEPIPAFIFAGALTLMGTTFAKATQFPTTQALTRSVEYNTLGIAGAGLTVTIFKF